MTGGSGGTIAEKRGSLILKILTCAANRTRRDDSWVDDEEYEDDDAQEEAPRRESRRARIMRGALARRKRVSEKFANPMGRQTDAALFSGQRMDGSQDDIQYRANGQDADADDVLFSGHRATTGQGDWDEYDPLLSGYSVTEPVAAAAAATTATQAWAAPVEPVMQTPPPVGAEQAMPLQDIEWQTQEAVQTPPTAIAPSPESWSAPEPAPEQQMPWSEDEAAYSAPPETQAVPEEPQHPLTHADIHEAAPVEEVKPTRPPLYYFEEVEEKRARERELLATWYQPTPEPVQETPVRTAPAAPTFPTADAAPPVPDTQSVQQVVSGAAATAAAAGPVFSLAAGAARTQVKEGIGPQLPRPNRVRVPTRRELASASFGIKLPSQRMAEERAREELQDIDDDALQQDELARQFAATQQQRYAEEYEPEAAVYAPQDDDEAAEAELARQFAATQQQRYAGEQPQGAHAWSTDDFAFSPTKTLVDDGPSEPLFTLSPEPEPEPEPEPAPVQPQQQMHHQPYAAQQPVHQPYVQPQQPAAAPVHAQPAPQPQESLIHPLLMRNGDSRPLQKPTTPLPSLELLTQPPTEVEPVDTFALEQMARLVEARLADFRIKADVVNYSPGPVITRFELNLAPGVKAARISNLSRDLARSLSTVAVRVVEVIPGKPYVGLELPNKKRQTVYLREVLNCAKFRDNPSPLTVVLGKDIAGDPVVADLAKMPHLLVAGTTGSGKSVGVNAMILSMLYKATPDEVRFIMIDPKMLELSVYEGIPHLLTEVVTDMKDAANALRWSVNEMERRYKLMSALGVRNLAGYNDKIAEAARMGRPIPDPYWKPGDSMDATHPVLEKLPYIVVMVDEFADLMMTVGKKVEELIARLAQKARAAGIHLVLATQRPSVDVITGLIKANIPTRIAFTVSSKIDSRTILDQGGAESLLGMGDMLYSGPNSSSAPVRVHGAFVRDEEVHAVVQDWKARGRPQYVDGITSDSESEGGAAGLDSGEELDPLFDQAVNFVTEKRKASISGVQRQFRIGYNRAARIIEQMEAQGIVSEPGHNGNREVLAPPPFE